MQHHLHPVLLVRATSGYILAEVVWYTDFFYAFNVPSMFLLRLQQSLISRGLLNVTCMIMFARSVPRKYTDLHRLLSAKFAKQRCFLGLPECNISSGQFSSLLHGLQLALPHLSFHLDGLLVITSSSGCVLTCSVVLQKFVRNKCFNISFAIISWVLVQRYGSKQCSSDGSGVLLALECEPAAHSRARSSS